MRKIISNIKKMSLFQKIQIISGLIPLYSFIFVFITSYVVCWKGKKRYFPLIVFSVVYFAFLYLTWVLNIHFAIKYISCCLISFIGNYFLICTQIKEK